MGEERVRGVELIVTSPLTRAVHTTMLGFGFGCSAPVIVDYDIREIGSSLPESKL
jgi:hypothetical protein